MKTMRTILPAASAILAVSMLAGVARAGISGSKHDFGQFGWAKNQICLPCHAPHNTIVKDASGTVVAGPLWNHTLSTATYDLYYNDAGQKVQGKVDTNSILCLSCHDGTVAVDSFGGGAGTQQLTAGLLGTDLTNDHPIGEAAVWPNPNPSYMVDPTLRDAQGIMPLRVLADGRKAVGCTSCHEPHNRKNQNNMLWVNNAGAATTVDGRAVSGSALCMNCHKK
jgi:Doubled CXXCH motif (Paired_CXXCH_1)